MTNVADSRRLIGRWLTNKNPTYVGTPKTAETI